MKLQISLHVLFAILSTPALGQIGPRICKMTPEPNVKFENAADIIFPRMSAQDASAAFAVEQIVIPTNDAKEITLIVRDKTGGLHLALGNSVNGDMTKKSLEARRHSKCVEDDPQTYTILSRHLFEERVSQIQEAKKKADEQNRFIGCLIKSISTVSLTDKSLVEVSQYANQSSSQLQAGKSTFGYGFPTTSKPDTPHSAAVLANRFTLLGEILPRNKAPKEFHRIADKEEDVDSQPTLSGRFLILDQYGRTHIVKGEDLSSASRAELSQSKTECQRDFSESPVHPDVINPETLPEKTPTIQQ